MSVTIVNEPRYVAQTQIIDRYTVKRSMVLVGPHVCEMCGFDLLQSNSYPKWSELTDDVKQRVHMGMTEHKRRSHSGDNVVESQATTEKTKDWLTPRSNP